MSPSDVIGAGMFNSLKSLRKKYTYGSAKINKQTFNELNSKTRFRKFRLGVPQLVQLRASEIVKTFLGWRFSSRYRKAYE